MTASTTTAATAELSCYTANLVTYLAYEDPDVPSRLAAAISPAVRADTADLVFSHHSRIDRDGRGRELGYRGAAEWDSCEAGLRAELAAEGRVLAVANTANLPWAPGDAQAPHWILLHGQENGMWLVRDQFAALLPHGEQKAHRGRLSSAELRAALSPVADPPVAVRHRDALALGEPIALPSANRFRWLGRVAERPAERTGDWIDDPVAVLRLLSDELAADPDRLAAHIDDLWAVGRHQRFKLALLPEHAEHPELFEPVLDAWGELPRSLRFALDSARRSRPRPGLVRTSFERLITVTEQLLAEQPHVLSKG